MRSSRGPRLVLSLLAIACIASPARAQVEESPTATIRLIAHTPWTTPEDPLVRITVRIDNEGAGTIANPVVGWRLGPRVTSRERYETALEEGPAFAAVADTVFRGSGLAPGDAIEVPITIDTAETQAIEDDSAVYPLQNELRSDDELVASMTTAVIHIFQDPPLAPVHFSWWTEVASPVAFGPDGTLIDPGFEAALGSGGGIVAQVEAIAHLLTAPDQEAAVDLIVAPIALDQLRRASDGYERRDGSTAKAGDPAPVAAAETLDRLREIARSPQARLHAMPFAAPRLPALLSSGLGTHLEAQWRLGDETFEELVGERPDPAVARPPGLVFDQASVDALAARGATTILGAPDSVQRPPQDNAFAPPPAAMLSTTPGGEVALLLPDPGAQALLSDPALREDPVLASQVLLGELATIWKEEPVPVPPVERGLALDLSFDLPAAFWRSALRRLTEAPFLQPEHAEDLPGEINPGPQPAALDPSTPDGFSSLYVQELSSTARRLSTFGAVVEEPAGEVDRLRRAVRYAEASQYVGNESSGLAWLDTVNGVIDRTFSLLVPDTSRVLRFTSRSGDIHLRMDDPGDRVLNFRVELASGRVDFLNGAEQVVRLDEANEVITFQAEVKAAGRSRIDVLVSSPDGVILAREVLVVSSTAINPIALVITLAAGVVLIGLWSRRLFRRRNL